MPYKPASIALRAGWFGGATASIFLPLLLFWVSRVQNGYRSQQYQNYVNYQNERYDGYWNNGDNNQAVNNNGGTPWWYLGPSDSQPGRENEKAPTMLLAGYLWSLSIFLGIVFYGYMALRNNTSTEGVMVALLMFAAYSFVSLFVFGTIEGAVETQGWAILEHGFLGQVGVLVCGLAEVVGFSHNTADVPHQLVLVHLLDRFRLFASSPSSSQCCHKD